MVVPVSGAGPAGTRLVLHEARVFGLDRERWVVSADAAVEAAAGLAGTVADTVTPVLPEVRVLVSDAAAELGAAAAESDGTPLTAVVRLLTVLELLGPDGGALPDGIDHLLHDPAAHVAAALIQRRAELEAALTAVVTGALAAPGGSAVDIDVDLAARSVTANLGATPGDVGMLPWTLQAVVSAGQRPRLSATLGSSGSTPAGGAVLRLSTEPALRLSLDWHRPGVASPQAISLWPEPDMGELLKGMARLVPTELGRIGLGYLRELDPTVTPIVDAALDAIGLLGCRRPGRPPGCAVARRPRRRPGGLVHPSGVVRWVRCKPVRGQGGRVPRRDEAHHRDRGRTRRMAIEHGRRRPRRNPRRKPRTRHDRRHGELRANTRRGREACGDRRRRVVGRPRRAATAGDHPDGRAARRCGGRPRGTRAT